MPKAGDVFIYKQYTFSDGTKRDKWFVILNTPKLADPHIVLKTTSNGTRYQNCIPGCNEHRRCFFAPISWQPCFNIDTYIQLPQIIQFSTCELIKAGLYGNIEYKSPLSTDCLAKLKMCIAKFKPDIAPVHWDLIFKKN